MDDDAVRERAPTFDLLASKLRPPLLRRQIVIRSALIERLANDDACPLVSVVAPAGYGKTTLLSQWAERGHNQSFAWVSVDEPDNDPKVLLTYVAEALSAVEPIDARVFDALTSSGSSVPGSVVPRLCSAFSSMTTPVVLVLDDVHALHSRECRDALSVLADHVPDGSRLVFAGRAAPPLRTARLRAEGKLMEISAGDLSLTPDEASSLVRNAGVVLAQDEMTELQRRTEGWAAGLYLAALSLREGAPFASAVVSFSGGDRFVSEYLESEFLSRISAQHRMFLIRTSVLERMCDPLCAAVLGSPEDEMRLAELAGANLLLVPLDRRRQWYRYHHLFRDMLLAELQRQEPELMPLLRRRAADWCQRNGSPEEALEYAMAAGDADAAAGLVEELLIPAFWHGRVATVQRWLRWLDEQGAFQTHPLAAVQAALIAMLTGSPVDAERFADIVDRWQYGNPVRPDAPVAEAWAALMRAMMCRRGAEQMLRDADETMRRFAPLNIPAPSLVQGIARVLCGDPGGADAFFQDAVLVAEQTGSMTDKAVALSEQSLLAIARSHWDQAADLAGQAGTALRQGRIEHSHAIPLACAVQARVAVHRGDLPAARRELISAQRLRPLLTYAHPHLAVQARIELARVHLALADLSGARTLMREIDELLARRPDLGTLATQATALRNQLAGQRSTSVPGASALTTAELRLLPLLSTHQSFPEIADAVFLSRYTIKSQAYSIYRKLGVTSRNQAVTRARELGLLEG
jgi:LuxR family maltose regulon positive regulatory protein